MSLKLGGIYRPSLRQAKVLVCISGALIAAIDFSLPANINCAIFYFLPIVLAVWTRSVRWLWISTACFMSLTFCGLVLAPAPIVNAVTWIDWLNRGITAIGLAVVAILVHLRLRTLMVQERTLADLYRTERALEESHRLLEARVTERTEALTTTNEILQKEIATRIGVEASLRKSESSLRELSADLLRAQDDERRHLGRELHDGLGQNLAGLKLNLHFLKEVASSAGERIRERYADCLTLTEDAVRQIRTVSHLLYPPLLDQLGLKAAIPCYVDAFGQRSGIKTTLHMPSHLPRLPSEVELTIFRILQESLTNVFRHSGSPSAQIALQITNGSVVLQVKDCGKGISQIPVGVGLRSMEERTKQLMGKLEIASGPEGTTVKAALPLPTHSTSESALTL